jgi:hypothetical protein
MKRRKKEHSAKGIVESGRVKGKKRRTRKRSDGHSIKKSRRWHSSGEMRTGLNRKGRIAVNEIIRVLELELGMITCAAKRLHVSHNTLSRFIQGNAKVQEALHEIQERALDRVETKLLKMIEEGNERALFFFLKTKGKQRGFGDPRSQPMVPTQPITFKYKLVLPEDYKQRNEKSPSPSPEKDVTEEEDSSEEE